MLPPSLAPSPEPVPAFDGHPHDDNIDYHHSLLLHDDHAISHASSSKSPSSMTRIGSSSSVLSSASSDETFPTPLAGSVPPRRMDTQHTATFLARSLWKPDREATKCDTYHCRTPFGFFQRKHHCRRCGGIFCQDCSAQVTELLDTSKFAYVYTPPGVPIETFATKANPMQFSRVCDDCFEHLHGTVPERQRQLRLQSEVTYYPTEEEMTLMEEMARRTFAPRKFVEVPPPPADTSDPFAGYPLRVPSAICKANGGGRWQPTPIPVKWHYCPPNGGGKPLFEIVNEEEEARRRSYRDEYIYRILKTQQRQRRASREY